MDKRGCEPDEALEALVRFPLIGAKSGNVVIRWS